VEFNHCLCNNDWNHKLVNVHWISIPVHMGDPIGVACGGAMWRAMFEKSICLLISVSPLARWCDCPHPGMRIADKETVGGG